MCSQLEGGFCGGSKKGMKERVMDRNDWIIIGISGVTCGGKTTLANQLRDALRPVYVIHQDKYFYPDDSPKHVRCKGLDHNNYDILSALNMEALLSDVTLTLSGDPHSHESEVALQSGRYTGKGKSFLIIEGFTVLNYPPVMELCDLRYYFVLDYEQCWARRCYRLYDPPDIPGYFEQCVWPEHLRYRAQIERDGRVTMLDGTQPNVLEKVMADIKALGATQIEDSTAS